MNGAHVSSAFESLRAGVPTEPHRGRRFRASCDKRYLTTVPCRGSFAQGGVTMRDCSKNRAGFDRVLMAVAATFLAVSATSAMLAQSDTPRASAAELAIEAAIPRPEPANVPPPTAGDFKIDSTASVPDRNQGNRRSRTSPHPPQRAAEPATEAGRNRHRACETNDTAIPPPAAATATPRPPRRRAAEPPEPVKAASNVAAGRSAGRRQDCAKCWPPNRCAISTARASAPRSRSSTRRANTRRCGPRPATLTDCAKGVIARLKDAAADGLDAAEYPVPDFAAADLAGSAGRSRTEADRQHARLCAPGAERPDALVAGLRATSSIPSIRPIPPRCWPTSPTAKDAVRGARQLQPAAQALQGTEGQARRIARPGRRTGDPDRRRSRARVQGRDQEAAGGRAGRSARAAAARQARHRRKSRRHQIRRQGRRSRAQIPGRRRPQADRRARRHAP